MEWTPGLVSASMCQSGDGNQPLTERGVRYEVGKQLKRSPVASFFAILPPCLIGMEACSSAHHWARKLLLAERDSNRRRRGEWWY
jgi:transposase